MATRKKKKKSFKWLFFLLIPVLILLYFKNDIIDKIYYNYYQISSKNNPTKVYIPQKYKVVGVDISRYQLKMDWNKMKIVNHVSDTIPFKFVIAKATEGTSYKDPMYNYHYHQSKNHSDIIFGAYHYFHPNRNAETQAKFFLKTAQLQSGNLVPVVDVEEKKGKTKEEIRKQLKIFCDYIEKEIGKKPIIYSGKHFMLNTLGESFKNYPLWVAHYEENDIEMPQGWNWDFWQLTDQGSTFATTENIDVNVLNGRERRLKNLCIP